MRSSTLRSLVATAAATVAVLALAGSAAAATIVVTQNSAGWHPLDTRPGGTVTFTNEFGAPPGLGSGALKLTTNATTGAKADYYTFAHAGTPILAVNDLAYWTYQAPTGQPPVADPSYQLQIDVNGSAPEGFTTLVFEPYWNVAQGPIVPGTWQHWDVDSGLFWSSRTVVDGTCVLAAGAGGPPLYTLTQIKTLCPNAVVLGIGVNIGTFNPGYTVGADGVQFNDTVYDFEVGRRPTSKDDCKDGGWATFNDPAFKNQGDCVSFTNNA
jgi:hypothetical protein